MRIELIRARRVDLEHVIEKGHGGAEGVGVHRTRVGQHLQKAVAAIADAKVQAGRFVGPVEPVLVSAAGATGELFRLGGGAAVHFVIDRADGRIGHVPEVALGVVFIRRRVAAGIGENGHQIVAVALVRGQGADRVERGDCLPPGVEHRGNDISVAVGVGCGIRLADERGRGREWIVRFFRRVQAAHFDRKDLLHGAIGANEFHGAAVKAINVFAAVAAPIDRRGQMVVVVVFPFSFRAVGLGDLNQVARPVVQQLGGAARWGR